MVGIGIQRPKIALLICVALLCVFLAHRVRPLFLLSEDWLCCGYFRQDRPDSVDWSLIAGDFRGGLRVVPENQQYRPLFGLFYAANFALFGFRPGVWHLTLLSLHVIAAILFGLLVRQLLRLHNLDARQSPILVALLFLLCPQSTVCVAWLGSCMDVAYTAASLATLLLFGRALAGLIEGRKIAYAVPWLLGALATMALGFMSKENTAALGPALLVHALFIVGALRKTASVRAWLLAGASLAPFALLTFGYLGLRTVLFASPFVMYEGRLKFDWLSLPLRLGRFLSNWYGKHNAYVFWDFSSALTLLGRVLGIAVVVAGVAGIATAAMRKRRLAMLAHVAALAAVTALPVLGRLETLPGAFTHDAYFLNGFLCAFIVLFLAAAPFPPRADVDSRIRRILISSKQVAAALLLTATVAFWFILLNGNLTAYVRSSRVCRGTFTAINELADSKQAFKTFDVPNVPRHHMGVTCATAHRFFLHYPFRRRPATVSLTPAPERIFFLIMDGETSFRLVERERFFREAKTLFRSTSGTLDVEDLGNWRIKMRFEGTIAPNARQYVYVRFRRERLRPSHAYLFQANLMWKAVGHPYFYPKHSWQIIPVADDAPFSGEVLHQPSRNPLYTREEAIEEFYVRWLDLTFSPGDAAALEFQEATILEYPGKSEAAAAPIPSME